VRLSTLSKGHRIDVPTRGTKVLNHWLGQRGASLIQGCALSEDGIVLWVDIPDQKPKKRGAKLGLDIGVHKLFSDSNGEFYGTDMKAVMAKVRRCKPGSKGKERARRERDRYVDQTVKELPWTRLSVLGIEDLTGLKTGRKPGRGKSFRKAMAPWTYRRARARIEEAARANRVCLVAVDPCNTSRTCPACSRCTSMNRKGERFRCIACGYAGDADVVGARNILAKTLLTLGSVASPSQPSEVE